MQITLSIDGTERNTHLTHDINLVHGNNDVFLGGSYDTRRLTQYFTSSNFYGTIQKVVYTLPYIQSVVAIGVCLNIFKPVANTLQYFEFAKRVYREKKTKFVIKLLCMHFSTTR